MLNKIWILFDIIDKIRNFPVLKIREMFQEETFHAVELDYEEDEDEDDEEFSINENIVITLINNFMITIWIFFCYECYSTELSRLHSLLHSFDLD